MNTHSVLVGLYQKDCSYSYTYRVMHWYMNMCDIYVLSETYAHIQVHTHMYEDLVNRGALKGVPKSTLKLHMCLNML